MARDGGYGPSRVYRSDAAHLLLQYSEWLDPQYMQAPAPGDKRTHDDLVKDFLAQRNPSATPQLVMASEEA